MSQKNKKISNSSKDENKLRIESENEELKQKVITLNDELFCLKIDESKNVEEVLEIVMLNIASLYCGLGGGPQGAAIYAEECIEKIKDVNVKLKIFYELLIGNIATIPGMKGGFRLWNIFYDPVTGKKIR